MVPFPCCYLQVYSYSMRIVKREKFLLSEIEVRNMRVYSMIYYVRSIFT